MGNLPSILACRMPGTVEPGGVQSAAPQSESDMTKLGKVGGLLGGGGTKERFPEEVNETSRNIELAPRGREKYESVFSKGNSMCKDPEAR